MSKENIIGVLGATSQVGQALLPLLAHDDFEVIAFSRRTANESIDLANDESQPTSESSTNTIHWRSANAIGAICERHVIPFWISLAPIQKLPEYFDAIKSSGARRIVALSSTSRFTKHRSDDPQDQALAQSFSDSEAAFQRWAENNGIEFVILRPTLIYGLGKDKSICEIIRLIRRFGFFPLLGEANGLRQPVHCRDVAFACFSSLHSESAANKSYNLSGAEVLSYKDMVGRIFEALQRKPRFFKAPMILLRAAVVLLRLIPRYRSWSFAMVERMNKDMVFDHHEAERDLDFRPRPFRLDAQDLP
ncbi:MAG: NAD-dependent epimerase/dehydratase family protein [Methylomicrobium sp.]|nr:NAD-dependent epimerase/dehydratase family protein [Methylomicrobium sp.]